MYNFSLLVGKSSLKSSHRMQSKVLDWISVCANLILTESLWQVSQPVSASLCVVFGESYYLPQSIAEAPNFLTRLMSRCEKNKAIWKQFTLSESYEQFLFALVCFIQAIEHQQNLELVFKNKLIKVWLRFFIHFIMKKLVTDDFSNIRFDILTS